MVEVHSERNDDSEESCARIMSAQGVASFWGEMLMLPHGAKKIERR